MRACLSDSHVERCQYQLREKEGGESTIKFAGTNLTWCVCVCVCVRACVHLWWGHLTYCPLSFTFFLEQDGDNDG